MWFDHHLFISSVYYHRLWHLIFLFISFEWCVPSILLLYDFLLKDNILGSCSSLCSTSTNFVGLSYSRLCNSTCHFGKFFDLVFFFHSFHYLSNPIACCFIFIFASFSQSNTILSPTYVIFSFICFTAVNYSDMLLSSIFSSC